MTEGSAGLSTPTVQLRLQTAELKAKNTRLDLFSLQTLRPQPPWPITSLRHTERPGTLRGDPVTAGEGGVSATQCMFAYLLGFGLLLVGVRQGLLLGLQGGLGEELLELPGVYEVGFLQGAPQRVVAGDTHRETGFQSAVHYASWFNFKRH